MIASVEELHIPSRLKHLAAFASGRDLTREANGIVHRQRGHLSSKGRLSLIEHMSCLLAALFAFLLLPGLHVLVHERETTREVQTQLLHAARALHHLHSHDGAHDDSTHEDEPDSPVPHQHSGPQESEHGRNAAEHLAAALTIAPSVPLLFPATLIEQLAPRDLCDRLPSHPRSGAHKTRGPPRS